MAGEEVYDVLGVGFGPANVSIAAVLAETNRKASPANVRRACFVESHPEFRWHPGMMIAGARMQISFLKDFATLRDPTSPYTFLNYLFHQNRLASFINRGTFTPTRREYADYMAWVALSVAERPGHHEPTGVDVCYSERVCQIEAVLDSATPTEARLLRVWSESVRDGTRSSRLCKNLIVSCGGHPSLPPAFRGDVMQTSDNVLHTSQYLNRIHTALAGSLGHYGSQPQASPFRVAVIGGGQSAVETFLDVRSRLNELLAKMPSPPSLRPQIDLLIRRKNLHPSDDSPFSNEVFDPASTDSFYDLGEAPLPHESENFVVNVKTRRQLVLEEALGTNYAVVNPNTLEHLYEEMYSQKVDDDIRMNGRGVTCPIIDAKMTILSHTEVTACTKSLDRFDFELSNVLTGETRSQVYDVAILGTGYTRQGWRDLLFRHMSDCEKNSVDGVSLPELFGCTPHNRNGFETLPTLSCSNSSSRSSHEDVGVSLEASIVTISTPTSSHASSNANVSEIIKSDSKPTTLDSSPMKTSHDPKLTPFSVTRNYRLILPSKLSHHHGGSEGKFLPQIWLQGSNEQSHGISDTLLSVLSVRAGEVVEDIQTNGNH